MSFNLIPTKSSFSVYGVPPTEKEATLKLNEEKRFVPGNYLKRQQLRATVGVEMSQKSPPPNKHREKNKTHVVSACKNISASPVTKNDCKLKLQRREMANKESPQLKKDPEFNIIQQDDQEKRLTLQRWLRTGSIEKISTETNCLEVGIIHSHSKQLQEEKTSLQKDVRLKIISDKPSGDSKTEIKNKGFDVVDEKPLYLRSATNGTKFQEMEESEDILKFRTIKNLVGAKGDDDKCSYAMKLGQDAVRIPISKNGSLDRQKTPKSGVPGVTRCSSVRDVKSHILTPKRPLGNLSIVQRKIIGTACSVIAGHEQNTNKVSLSSDDDHKRNQNFIFQKDSNSPLIEENCAVTVAVRVRPFNNRERSEKAAQVVFMSGQETSVQHSNSKQKHSFLYDFSFWSFEKLAPSFASQQFVYEKLAVPLLERSLLGYNTCLFAYGQTGSGKSYTMMGFDEEPGIIPRFCSDLFSRIQTTKNQQVSYHLEMSYFEVYNEKIHDLLVFKADDGNKKQPLRVREHQLLGPYVEDLSANVVSSFQDIKSWLELGNKQRATAATGMNDKSSRSHSVFTLIMTQTTTEYMEGEEHDHRITSRINLVDLAGSERCSMAQTSGERLKEGVSINKSLLTLGKVISALSEGSQTHKNVFIPYRESVLTWLLKESLGGNSKTSMIATVSPAASNIEETLSTLRYARQARLIINIAKVNEDMNTKLIKELKSEIEKLKASQRSAKNTDSEKYKQCQQEISSLKLKLIQQAREMSELRGVWKDRLEKAEQRKKEETRELQKAGITFKMDNRFPNLVNLNEDPQLSEMLLYMIKEGHTTVGKYQAGSEHDIQLSGALIAEDHCVITNIANTVSITASGDAKIYVNGNQISASTVLHHGDRVILGGEHYFRFNHPVEVQKLKGASRVSTIFSEGTKDFEFAKNELLTAQRFQLEDEIEEARLRAKEEMMKEIQMAKEMAQKELMSQRSAYENKIKALENELKEESQKKQMQEVSSQRAVSKIQELEKAKMHLQQEVQVNKRRLEMETFAAKQALEDHTVRHAKILHALEAEKEKIAREVQTLQQERSVRGRSIAAQPTWNSMKLSVMIQEANMISSKLRKHTTFRRHDVTDKENTPGGPVQIQVRNLKLGIVTYWSIEKFESNLAAMKELYENKGTAEDDDVFYDPGDEWDPDLSNSSVSTFSRRRSLLKNRRISGCLYEIRVHPIQSLQSGHTSGMMNKSSVLLSKPSNVCSDPPGLHLPGICKELIGSALEYLGRSHADEHSFADSLINTVHTVCVGVDTVSQEYKQQDQEGSDTLFFESRTAQTQSFQLSCAFQQLVVLSKHWLDHIQDKPEMIKPADDLHLYIKKLGGYLQLILQGCCSDIPSMVTEAKDKIQQISKQIMQSIGHLSAVTSTDIHCFQKDESDEDELHLGNTLRSKSSFTDALFEGLQEGLENLIDSGIKTIDKMQKDVQRCTVQDMGLITMKKNSLAFSVLLQHSLADCKMVDLNRLLRGWIPSTQSSVNRELHNLKSYTEHLSLYVINILKGSETASSQLIKLLDNITVSASHLNKDFLLVSHEIIKDLNSLAKALTLSICVKAGPGSIKQHTVNHSVVTPIAIE